MKGIVDNYNGRVQIIIICMASVLSLPVDCISAVTNGTTYYVVTAVDTDGYESGCSNEVSAKPDLFQTRVEVNAGGYGLPSDLFCPAAAVLQ